MLKDILFKLIAISFFITISKSSLAQCNYGIDLYLLNDSTFRCFGRYQTGTCNINVTEFPVIGVNSNSINQMQYWGTWGPYCPGGGGAYSYFICDIPFTPNSTDTLNGYVSSFCNDVFVSILKIDSNNKVHFGNFIDLIGTVGETTRSTVTNNFGTPLLEIFNEQEVLNPVMSSGIYSGTISNVSDVSDTLQMLFNNLDSVEIQCTDGTLIMANTSGYNNLNNSINFSASIPNGKIVTRVLAGKAWIKVPEFLSGGYTPIPSVSQIPTSICANAGIQFCKLSNPVDSVKITLDNNQIAYSHLDSSFSYLLGAVGVHNIHIDYYYLGATSSLDTSFTTLSLPIINNVDPFNGYHVCNGSPVILNATGGALSYLWTFTGATGGNSYNGSVLNNTPFSITNSNNIYGQYYYYFKVVANSANGCIDSITQVPVIVKSTSNINITSIPTNSVVCTGQNVTLNATGTVGYNPIFSWSGGVSNNVSFTPISTTTYTVTCTSYNGCTNTSTILVTVDTPSIAITASPNDTICAGTALTLTASGGTSYSWSGGITNGASFTPAASGTYTVTVTNANGCTKTQTQSIVVNPLPTVSITALPNDTICAGTALTLTASGGTSYSWSGGVTNGTSFTPATSGTYTVTVTNANGCTNTQTQSIVVNSLPTVSITALPNDTICAGTALTLTASGGTSYSWSGGITNGSSFTPTTSGTYTVTVTSSSGCTKDDSIYVHLKTNIIPIISITSNPSQGVTNDPIVYSASTNVSLPYSIEWYRNSLLSYTGNTNSWNDIIVSGNNSIFAIIKSPSQCLNPDSAKSNTITILNQTVGFTTVSKEDGSLIIYPNPTSEIINVDLQLNNSYKMVSLKTIDGQIIETIKVNTNNIQQIKFNVKGLANGTYIIIADKRNGEKEVAKFIKE